MVMFDLVQLERHARAQHIRLVSVDLYDTLLLRGTRPELVRFRDIAAQWHKALGSGSPGVEALYQCRLSEHKAAYDRVESLGGHGEVRYEAVLGKITECLGLPAAVVPILAAAEIAYEKTVVGVNASLVALLLRLRREKPVVFLSDMYLSGNALTGIMAALVPELADLPLFVSSDLGLTKRHGTVFPHFVSTCSLMPQDVLHVGDNPISDFSRARAAGLNAMLLPRGLMWRIVHGVRRRRARRKLMQTILRKGMEPG